MKRGKCHLRMSARRNSDDRGLDLVKQLVKITNRTRTKLVCNLGSPAVIGVVDPDQACVRQIVCDSRVVIAETAYPDDGERQRGLQRVTPRWLCSKKPRNISTSGSARSSSRARASAWLILCSEA